MWVTSNYARHRAGAAGIPLKPDRIAAAPETSGSCHGTKSRALLTSPSPQGFLQPLCLERECRRRLLTIGRVELAQIAPNTLLKLRPTRLHFTAREVPVVQELAKSLRREQRLPHLARAGLAP
jgi:hypothetical protein